MQISMAKPTVQANCLDISFVTLSFTCMYFISQLKNPKFTKGSFDVSACHIYKTVVIIFPMGNYA